MEESSLKASRALEYYVLTFQSVATMAGALDPLVDETRAFAKSDVLESSSIWNGGHRKRANRW